MLIKILYLFILTSCSGHTVEDDTNPSLEDSENNGVSSQSNTAPIISQEIDGNKEIKTVEYPDKKTVTESLSNEYFDTYYKTKETEYVKRNDEWAIKEKKSFSSGQTLIKSERYFTSVEKGNPLKWIYETTESGEFKSMKAYAIDIETAQNSYFEAMNISPVDDSDNVNGNVNFKIKCYQNSTEKNSYELKNNKSPETLYDYLIQKCPNILSELKDENE